jgi:hypothetical protein
MTLIGSSQSAPTADSETRLFPSFLSRVGAVPVAVVLDLCQGNCEPLLTQLHSYELEYSQRRELISEILYRTVPNIADTETRRFIVRLRRELFNGKVPSRAHLESLERILGSEERELVLAYYQGLVARAACLHSLREVYLDETRRARRLLKKGVRAPLFQNGLLLSSASLFHSQVRYQQAGEEYSDGRLDRVERGLLRYLSRAALKATPFSTFAAIAHGELRLSSSPRLGVEQGLRFEGVGGGRRSEVRLNKGLLPVLARLLLARAPVRHALEVECNPTILDDDARYSFLAGDAGREMLQRMAKTPPLALVRELADHVPPPRFTDLVHALVADPRVQATYDDAMAYLERLIETGFLRTRLGVPEQDVDWDISFARSLEGIADPEAQYVRTLLVELREAAIRFEASPADARRDVLVSVRARVDEVLTRLAGRTLTFGPLVFMEDCALEQTAVLSRGPALGRVEQALGAFGRLMHRIAASREEHIRMRHFFDSHYGDRTPSIPLLQFYEDYHREHLKEYLARQQLFEQRGAEALNGYSLLNPFGLPVAEELLAVHDRIRALIAERWAEDPNAEEIVVSMAELEALAEAVPTPASEALSVSVFGEMLPPSEHGDARLIITKGWSLGYGKLYSRFLYFLPDSLRRDLLDANARRVGVRLAEIHDDGDHNANLHPPLLPWTLRYPSSESASPHREMQPTELSVQRHPQDALALVLTHDPSGERVVPLDLGFVWRRARPALYQLLQRFAPPLDYSSLPLPATPAPATPQRPRSVPSGEAPEQRPEWHGGISATAPIHRPRIVVEGVLVFARRSWRVPSHDVPRQGPSESATDYFLRLNQWRIAHSIPREVFIRLASEAPSQGTQRSEQAPGDLEEVHDAENDSPEESIGAQEAKVRLPPKPRRASRQAINQWKPQYIDFANPLFVRLFARLVQEDGVGLVLLEERLPRQEHLPLIDGEAFAAEQLYQVEIAMPPAT